MASFAVIPAAPILVAGVDLAETSHAAQMRAAIESCLLTRSEWTLPVTQLPPLAGLGGLGIDRGIDTRTNELLEGEEWVQAVSKLSPADRAVCESAHPAIAVALLHAHSVGVRIGALAGSESPSSSGAPASNENLLVPIDLSAAASEEAPLAPVPGATQADERIVAALSTGDPQSVATAVAAAADVHADLELLEAAAAHMLAHRSSDYSFTTVFDENLHEVRSLCGTGTY
ncbi:hypothetical protein [Brevibacterium aurantiacum]|uniref:Uncharacterized protein n=1 Tax=Brevibacterium aurantiacum TaxID=273384 RepID=A0A2H1IT47_BREAU|nr:hypothetical protein [Brevibacterium aurantiacum]SMX78373.1 hypothetical protein BAUR920_01399 [Brevibacterium aurantiacum]